MDNNRYCIIMAGGIGSRFWPISRRTMPKQFLDMLGTGKSFIRHTYERFAKIVPPENFLVVTNGSYKPLVLEHIPEIDEDQILSEPVGRNTAPCIAYAAWRLRVAAPDATMIVTPSDHLILDEDEFRRAIVESAEFAERQRAHVTIGIRRTVRPPATATYRSTIRSGWSKKTCTRSRRSPRSPTWSWRARSSRAASSSGTRAYSSGKSMRSWKTSSDCCPTCTRCSHRSLRVTALRRNSKASKGSIPSAGTSRSTSALWRKPATSTYAAAISAGRTSERGVRSTSIRPRTPTGTVAPAENMLYDTKGCIVKVPAGKLAVIEGLEDYIVVDSGDVLMICPKSGEQNIKKFIDDVKFKIGDRFI